MRAVISCSNGKENDNRFRSDTGLTTRYSIPTSPPWGRRRGGPLHDEMAQERGAQ